MSPGSSPRVRGTVRLENLLERLRNPVHPRVCGEQSLADNLRADRDRRFIPACAGNRSKALSARTVIFTTVHPRVCGEQTTVPSAHADQTRFIPACAGNRLSGVADYMRVQTVHPRVCGEQISRNHDNVISKAVHPRVCGEQRFDHRFSIKLRRFIPACAGNSICVVYLLGSGQSVHPRVCGEQSSAVNSLSVFDGSSPRVRGTVFRNSLDFTGLIRFIPACAGNRLIYIAKSGRDTVHPRVCGEQT